MPIYLSEFIGSGKTGDLFRPIGSDQPGSALIDLRHDGGATRDGGGLNRCLLYLPTHDPDARLYQLADQKGENVPLAVRAGLAARLNATIAYTRLDDVIADLLLRPPARAWKPLRDRADRQLAIYLGGLLSPSPALRALAAKIYSETWSTANNASLTSDLTWVEDFGTNWELSGNRARLEGNGGFNVVHADHQTDTDDQIVSATLATFTRDATGQVVCSLLGRFTDIDNLYQVQANISTTWTIKALEKFVAGAGTTLATISSTTNPGDGLRLTMVDSSIAGVIGGTLLGPVTDTAISGVRYAGLSGYGDHAANRIEVDNWSVRDYAQAAPFTVRQSTLRGGDVLRGVAGGLEEVDGSSSGSGAATGVGAAIDTGDGSAAGVGTASGSGAAIAKTDGASTGAGTASGAAATVLPGAASADGSGGATGAGAAIDAATGSADGVGGASGAGQSTAGAVGVSAGTGAPSGAGAAIDGGEGVAAGSGAAAGVAAAIAMGDGSADGLGTASGAGSAIDGAVGAAAGVGTAESVGVDAAGNGAIGSAAGSSVVVSLAAAIDAAPGAAAGTSEGAGLGAAVQPAAGSSVGMSPVSGQAQAIDAGTGAIDADAQAAGQSGMIVSTTGVAAGTSAVAGDAEVPDLLPVVVLTASARAYRLVARPRGFDRSAQRRRFTVRALAREYVQQAATRIYVMQSIHD